MLSPLVDDDNIEVGIGDAVVTGPPNDTMGVVCGCCCGGWLTDIAVVSPSVLSLLMETGGCPAEVGCPADVGCCPTDTGCCCRIIVSPGTEPGVMTPLTGLHMEQS